MTSYSRIGIVTGANKGIGLAIVRQIALQYPRSQYNNGALLIYLTARNEDRGKAAVEAIKVDADLKRAKALRADGGLADVKFLPLDIDSTESTRDFVATIKKAHPDGIDFLINNAGIAVSGFNTKVVNQTLHCNYFGTYETTKQLLPHIRDGGRLVNVASMAGHLSGRLAQDYSDEIKSRFYNARSPDDLTQLMEEFSQAVENGSHKSDWPNAANAAYAVSKAGVIGMTKAYAQQYAQSGSKTLINSCCPGYVVTDMTKGGGVKNVDQGAQTPVLLAIGDIQGSNGQFWQDEKPIQW